MTKYSERFQFHWCFYIFSPNCKNQCIKYLLLLETEVLKVFKMIIDGFLKNTFHMESLLGVIL